MRVVKFKPVSFVSPCCSKTETCKENHLYSVHSEVTLYSLLPFTSVRYVHNLFYGQFAVIYQLLCYLQEYVDQCHQIGTSMSKPGQFVRIVFNTSK